MKDVRIQALRFGVKVVLGWDSELVGSRASRIFALNFESWVYGSASMSASDDTGASASG